MAEIIEKILNHIEKYGFKSVDSNKIRKTEKDGRWTTITIKNNNGVYTATCTRIGDSVDADKPWIKESTDVEDLVDKVHEVVYWENLEYSRRY